MQTLLAQNGDFTLGQAIAVGTAISLVIVAVLMFLGLESKGRVFTVDN